VKKAEGEIEAAKRAYVYPEENSENAIEKAGGGCQKYGAGYLAKKTSASGWRRLSSAKML
jgi:hypothetical protein